MFDDALKADLTAAINEVKDRFVKQREAAARPRQQTLSPAMPSLIDLRRRIRSVKNTQQITKAMKMVSAAKLRRAQERVIAARPYANLMREMLADLAAAAQSDERASESPWLAAARTEAHRSDLLLQRHRPRGRLQFQPAQSLAEVFRRTTPGAEITLTLVGRKGRDFYRRRGAKILARAHQYSRPGPPIRMRPRSRSEVIRRYRDGETDAVFVLNNEFKSVMSQKLSVHAVAAGRSATGRQQRKSRITSTNNRRVDMLDRLMPRYVEVAIFRAHARNRRVLSGGAHDGHGQGILERERRDRYR